MINQNITFKDWIIALKSGEYSQGINQLHQVDGSKDTYCCLGVYAHLCGVTTAQMDCRPNALNLSYTFNVDSVVVVKHLNSPTVYDNYIYDKLAHLNDSGHTFEEIADLLIFYCWINGIEQ